MTRSSMGARPGPHHSRQSADGSPIHTTSRPALGPALTKPFRREIVPEPDPDCATTRALGEAETRDAAEADPRRALSQFGAGLGFLDEIAGEPAQAWQLARIPIGPRGATPPVW